MSPGGGDSVSAGATLEEAADVGCGAGALLERLEVVHAAAQSPAAARTRTRRVTTIPLPRTDGRCSGRGHPGGRRGRRSRARWPRARARWPRSRARWPRRVALVPSPGTVRWPGGAGRRPRAWPLTPAWPLRRDGLARAPPLL